MSSAVSTCLRFLYPHFMLYQVTQLHPSFCCHSCQCVDTRYAWLTSTTRLYRHFINWNAPQHDVNMTGMYALRPDKKIILTAFNNLSTTDLPRGWQKLWPIIREVWDELTRDRLLLSHQPWNPTSRTVQTIVSFCGRRRLDWVPTRYSRVCHDLWKWILDTKQT